MKLYLVIFVTVTLISNTQCGLIDGLFGAVKDTTNTIRQDIGGVVRYGKNMVFGENKPPSGQNNNATDTSLANVGLIDRVSLKIHNIATGVREHFRHAIAIVDNDEHGRGLLGRLYERLKNRFINVKRYLFGYNANGTNDQSRPYSPPRHSALLTEKLRQYVLRNSSSSNSGIRKTLQSLRETLEALRNNVTKHKNKEPESDGAGLIDVRMAPLDVDNNLNMNRNLAGGVQDIYNKVGENTRNSYDDLRRGSNNFIEDQRSSIQNNNNKLNNNRQNGIPLAEDSLNEIESRFKSDVDSTNDYFKNAYSAVDNLEKH